MRVYVALPLPDTFKAELSQWLLPLRKENSLYNWVDDTEDLHITINFPGELDARSTHLLLSVVRESAADFRPIRASASGFFLCCFHRSRDAPASSRSSWLFGRGQNDHSRWGGVDCIALKFKDGIEGMTALADSIDTALMRTGKETDYMIHERIQRPFIPYVVIVRRGRPRNPVVLYSKGKHFHNINRMLNPPLECVLDKVTVYMSDKMSSGDVWTAQKVFRL